MAAAAASKEALWHRNLRRDLRLPTVGPTPVWRDNQGALVIVKDPVQRARTKHIDAHQRAVRERVARTHIVFGYCPQEHMIADVLTRPVFGHCRRGMGLK
jgi:hypothetical protein